MSTMKLTDLPKDLSKEEMKMLEQAEKSSITFDEDCPEMTADQLKQFKRMSAHKDYKES